jgi:hypothetical protein
VGIEQDIVRSQSRYGPGLHTFLAKARVPEAPEAMLGHVALQAELGRSNAGDLAIQAARKAF